MTIYTCGVEQALSKNVRKEGKLLDTLRKLKHVLDELEDKDIDTNDVVVNPKAIHIIVPDDVEEEQSEAED